MNYFHTPAFLGRTDDAVREFERLVAQQGARTDRPCTHSRTCDWASFT